MIYKILVKPKANKQSVERIDYNGESLLQVKVKAMPQNGEANDEVITLLSKYFSVSKSRVVIKSGLQSKFKYITIN